MNRNISVDRIKNLDLEPIMVKALDKEEGLGWDLGFTKRITEEYRKYLILCLENPNQSIVSSKHIDEFWHLHILDTRKYQEDCQNIFGYFLHHFPYFGMRNEQDFENLQRASNETKKLYEKKIGSINPELWMKYSRCPNCGVRCKDDISDSSEVRPTLSALKINKTKGESL